MTDAKERLMKHQCLQLTGSRTRCRPSFLCLAALGFFVIMTNSPSWADGNLDQQSPPVQLTSSDKEIATTSEKPVSSARKAKPRRAAGPFLAGQYALRRGQIRLASSFIGLARKADPNSHLLTRRLFWLNLELGRLDQADTLIDQAPYLGSEVQAALLRTVRLATKGETQQALAFAQRINGDGLEKILKHTLLFWLYRDSGQLDDAKQSLGDLTSTGPRYALFLKGMAEEIDGDKESSSKAYQSFAELKNDDPEEKTNQVKPNSTQDTEPNPTQDTQANAESEQDIQQFDEQDGRAMGLGLRQVKRLAAFFRNHDKKITQDLRDAFADNDARDTDIEMLDAFLADSSTQLTPLTNKVALAESLSFLADWLAGSYGGDFSVHLYWVALSLDPKATHYRYQLSRLLASQKRLTEATEQLKIVRRDPIYAWNASLLISKVLDLGDKLDEAVEELRKLEAKRPQDHEPSALIGELYWRRSQFPEAVLAYQTAMQRVEALDKQPDWQLHYKYGMSLERTGRVKEAELQFKLALDREPNQPHVLNYLGYMWIDDGRNLQDGRSMIERAVKQLPNNGFIIDSLGWVFYRLGNYESAVRELERAVAIEPNDPVINDHLGDALWQTGRHEEARFHWQRVLGLEPDEKVEASAQLKLKHGLDGTPLVVKE